MGYIVLNSKFKPFSYQEMLAPIMQAQEEHNKIEEELGNLDIMASDIAAKLTNNPEDKELRDLYNSFNVELNKASDELSTRGLTPQTRKNLIALKTQYTEKLNPINDAYKAYVEDQKYLDRLAIEHPEIIVEGAGKSISDYMYGKTPQMRSVNTDDLMNQAMAMAKTQAGRTYKQSGWTSTAGGRFLERTTEIGLNDIDFNNALYLIENPGLKASDLGITEAQFNKIKNNANLIEASIDDIINTPDFEKLSPENQRKAMNSIMKGVRAGFQYDKKDNIQSDPMFAHNLALERDALKRQQDALDAARKARKDTTSNIGSSTYRAINLGKEAVDKYLSKDNVGNVIIADKYKDFLNYQGSNGKIKNRELLERHNRELAYNSPTRGMSPQYSSPIPKYDLKAYDEFVSMVETLGLNPETATTAQIIKRMQDAENTPDAFGRKRASIVTPDTDLIQTYIEKGLRDNTLQEIEGFEKGEDGVFRYKNKESVKLDKLLDNNGKLNILSIDMDYTTGERTFTIKDKNGKLREFRMPDDASFESTDQLALETNSSYLRKLESDIDAGLIIDDDKTLYVTPYGNITASQYREMLQDELDSVFASILNYMGKNNIN